MNRALFLDFQRDARRWPFLGAVVLAAGIVALAVVALQYRGTRAELTLWQAKIADYQRLAQRGLTRISGPSAEREAVRQEVQRANALLAQITLPWGGLFRELEAATEDDVALLAVQPDAANRQVRVSGEARSFEALLKYVARLERLDAFANVYLLSHEFKQGGPQKSLDFSVVADWVSGS